MLAFLDAGVNVKGAPNENFAREIMELFSMGVGNYSEKDIREAARAFTGWNFRNLTFQIDPDKHDSGAKTVLGHTGDFDGVADVIKMAVSAEHDVHAPNILLFFWAHWVAHDPRIHQNSLSARGADAERGVAQPCESDAIKIHRFGVPDIQVLREQLNAECQMATALV